MLGLKSWLRERMEQKINRLDKGAKQAIEVCFDLKSGERAVIITDQETMEVGRALERAARKRTVQVKLFLLEKYGPRPIEKVPEELKQALGKAEVGIFAAQKKGTSKATEVELRKNLRVWANNHRARYANMPGVTKEVMETGMNIDQKRLWDVTRRIFEQVKNCQEIRVKTEKGTELKANFSPRLKWVASDSDFRKLPQKGTNLPGCEVFTCPARVEGKAVIDGILGDYLVEYGSLDKTPMIWTIKNSRVIKAECENKELEKEFKRYIKADKNANRIGEFAMGTNIGLKKMIGVMLQDEKFPSVHMAVGNSYPDRTKAKWGSKVHCDGIMKKTDVWVDGQQIMEKGQYLFKDL